MVDVANPLENAPPQDETPNQRQARLRREKRQKKMAEQGEDRLAKIKSLNGGVAPPEEVLGGPVKKTPQPATVDDPDEVDISENPSGYGTPSRPSQPHADAQENPLAAAMMQMQQDQAQNRSQQNAEGTSEEDPMMRMMQQMMGLGANGNPNDPNMKQPDLPPMMQAMLNGGQATQQGPTPTSSAYMWRIVHTVFSFALASYIALSSTFNGSELERSRTVYTEDGGYGLGQKLFLMFCTAELVLQSSRYFMEKGQLQGGGMLATVANSGIIPEPWAGYIRMVGRYIGIVQTIFADAMMVIFCFGTIAWWQGATTA